MATDVDILNLALANLGDTATVTSFTEASVQASLGSRFYPIARDSLLEMHTWGFSTKRVALALFPGFTSSAWDYAYAQPNDALNLLAVIPSDASDDYSVGIYTTNTNVPTIAGGTYVPQPFVEEVDPTTGTQLILTDQPTAVLRYTAVVTDTTQFSPLFVTTLGWHLSSMLAGPLLKGDAGMSESLRCLQMMKAYLTMARESDSNQRKIQPAINTDWIANR